MSMKTGKDSDKSTVDKPHDSCLLLLFNPFKESSTSNSIDQELELIPIATSRQNLQATRDFIENRSFVNNPRTDRVFSLNEGESSKRIRLTKPSSNQIKQPNLPRLTTTWETLQPTIYTSTEIVGTMAPHGGETSSHRLKDDRISHSKRMNDLNNYLACQATHDTGELLPATVFDPNELFTSSKVEMDESEAIGIPSPKYRRAFLADSTSGETSPTGCCFPGLDVMIRNGTYDSSTIPTEDGFYHPLAFKSARDDNANIGSVNAQQPNVNHKRSDVDSVYAQVYAANPFDIDFYHGNDEDLSMRATLFPSIGSPDASTSSKSTKAYPDTPGSSSVESYSDTQFEDEMAIITKNFHHALSSIAKEKVKPNPPAFGLSSKAMSLLGHATSQSKGQSASSIPRIKNKPAPLVLVEASKRNATQTGKRQEDGNCHSPKQQLKDTIANLGKVERDSIRYSVSGQSSKVASILGMDSTPRMSAPKSPNRDIHNRGPHTNSTLYNKLYSQVLKPAGLNGFQSDVFGVSPKNDGYTGGTTTQSKGYNEPVKRSTLLPLNPSLDSNSLPVSPLGSTYTDDWYGDAEQFKVSPLKIVKKRGSVANSHRLTFQDMAGLSENFRKEVEQKYRGEAYRSESSSGPLSSYAGNQASLSPTPIRRKPTPQQFGKNMEFNKSTNPSIHAITRIEPPVKFNLTSESRLPSFSGSSKSTQNVDQGFAYPKRPKSPVKRMLSSTVGKISRMMDVNITPAFHQPSNGIVVNEAADLKISIHAADQNRLFGDLEYIIQDTANRFLLFQHSRGRLSSHSVEKQARIWHQKNRPQVAQFLYPIAVQRELVEQNLDTIIFHGPLSGNSTAIHAIMHTWKYVAQELSIRSFCLPDAGLQHFLRESSRLLELLGVAEGHMLHFQAWYNLVGNTVRDNYEIPYGLDYLNLNRA